MTPRLLRAAPARRGSPALRDPRAGGRGGEQTPMNETVERVRLVTQFSLTLETTDPRSSE